MQTVYSVCSLYKYTGIIICCRLCVVSIYIVHVPSQSCLTLCNPVNCSHETPLCMGLPRQEYWGALKHEMDDGSSLLKFCCGYVCHLRKEEILPWPIWLSIIGPVLTLFPLFPPLFIPNFVAFLTVPGQIGLCSTLGSCLCLSPHLCCFLSSTPYPHNCPLPHLLHFM